MGELSLNSPERIKDAEDAFAMPEHSTVAIKRVAAKNLTVRFNGLWQGSPIASSFGGTGLDTSAAAAGSLLRTTAPGPRPG